LPSRLALRIGGFSADHDSDIVLESTGRKSYKVNEGARRSATEGEFGNLLVLGVLEKAIAAEEENAAGHPGSDIGRRLL